MLKSIEEINKLSIQDFEQEEDIISDINVVPLVDVTLVVLIIFMVTAPLFLKPSIQVKLPKATSGDKTVPSKFSVTISKQNILFLNGERTTEDQIQKTAKDLLAKNPQLQAIIAADETVSHGRVISILDLIKLTGVKKFALTIEKK